MYKHTRLIVIGSLMNGKQQTSKIYTNQSLILHCKIEQNIVMSTVHIWQCPQHQIKDPNLVNYMELMWINLKEDIRMRWGRLLKFYWWSLSIYMICDADRILQILWWILHNFQLRIFVKYSLENLKNLSHVHSFVKNILISLEEFKSFSLTKNS